MHENMTEPSPDRRRNAARHCGVRNCDGRLCGSGDDGTGPAAHEHRTEAVSDPTDFVDPPADVVDPMIDTNPHHPLRPSRQRVRNGTTEIGSRTVPHTIITRMIDVIRIIDGVPTITARDHTESSKRFDVVVAVANHSNFYRCSASLPGPPAFSSSFIQPVRWVRRPCHCSEQSSPTRVRGHAYRQQRDDLGTHARIGTTSGLDAAWLPAQPTRDIECRVACEVPDTSGLNASWSVMF